MVFTPSVYNVLSINIDSGGDYAKELAKASWCVYLGSCITANWT